MELASYIDHTILKADCTLKQIETLCKEAKSNSFAAVCVPPYYVKDAVRLLEESGVKVTPAFFLFSLARKTTIT